MSSIISISSHNCYIKSETTGKQYLSGLQPSLTDITRYVSAMHLVRISPLGFVLTPTKVPIGTYHRQVIYMKSKASTTTLSSNTTRKDLCLVTHPDFSPHTENNNPPKW